MTCAQGREPPTVYVTFDIGNKKINRENGIFKVECSVGNLNLKTRSRTRYTGSREHR